MHDIKALHPDDFKVAPKISKWSGHLADSIDFYANQPVSTGLSFEPAIYCMAALREREKIELWKHIA